MKTITTLIITFFVFSAMNEGALAQAPVGLAPQPVSLRTPAELEQMLSPIALYPDPLMAEILPAATQPAEIVLADRYLSEGGDVNQIDFQPWDGSIKTLARDPALLRWLDDNLTWTTQVGQAFLYQQADVMDAIQRLRARALALGNLASTPQQTVISENGLIEIVPANPQIVYVPVYQPAVVYEERPPYPGGFISFGVGFPVGLWLNHDFDWRYHHVVVWHHDHPRPLDWWYRRPSERSREPANVTVWRPHSPAVISERDRESRGWAANAGRPPTSVSPTERRVPERPTPAPRQEARPGTQPTLNPRPATPSRPAENPGTASRVAPQPRTEPRATPTRPAAEPRTVPSRPATGALVGVQSAPETQQYSARGQQSRQAAARSEPAPARSMAPAPAPAPAPAARTPSTPSSSGERNRR